MAEQSVKQNTSDIAEDLDKQFKIDPPKDKAGVKYMYMVGMREDGQPFFKLNGDIDVVNLEGLHAIAGRKVKTIVDSALGTGDAITIRMLEQLSAMVDYSMTIADNQKDPNRIVRVDAAGNVIQD